MQATKPTTISVEEYSAKPSYIYSLGNFSSFILSLNDLRLSSYEEDAPINNSEPFFKSEIYQGIDQEEFTSLLSWLDKNYTVPLNESLKVSFTHSTNNLVFKNNMYLYPDRYPKDIVLKTQKLNGSVTEYSKKVIITKVHDISDTSSIEFVGNSLKMKTILRRFEYSILFYIAQGFTSDEIGRLLNLSIHTINDYRKLLLKKFNANTIYQLIKNAAKKELI